MKHRAPDHITHYTNDAKYQADTTTDVRVSCVLESDKIYIKLKSDYTPIKHLRLRWNFTSDEAYLPHTKILGDEWERGYGAMAWNCITPERCMPWYFFATNASDTDSPCGQITKCFGVMVRPSAMAFWQTDTSGVTLWLDVRNGGNGVVLMGRELDVCTVLFRDYADMSAFSAAKKFCSEMCTDPILPKEPVYGSNNWYYAYGSSSHNDIVEDTKLVATYTQGLENRPFMVIDDGWQKYGCDGPWLAGHATKFPDMKKLADEMTALDVKPGIWVRYLSDTKFEVFPKDSEMRLARENKYLDPSHPDVIANVIETTKRMIGWGYQLIKHDFSTFDIFGGWGFNFRNTLGRAGDWSFYNKNKTSAEIVLDFYSAILGAAGDALILGCNCIGHLCAGLHHLNRTGDDTSGQEWERTRKMGVNTLAFRMPQNNTFFAADADCVGITKHVAWEKNRLWLKALANSGSPLFVSCTPNVLDESQLDELKEAFRVSSIQKDRFVPLDWVDTICPTKWTLNGEEITFDWYQDAGCESVNLK